MERDVDRWAGSLGVVSTRVRKEPCPGPLLELQFSLGAVDAGV